MPAVPASTPATSTSAAGSTDLRDPAEPPAVLPTCTSPPFATGRPGGERARSNPQRVMVTCTLAPVMIPSVWPVELVFESTLIEYGRAVTVVCTAPSGPVQ